MQLLIPLFFCHVRLQPGGATILFEDESLVIFRPRDPCAEKHFLVSALWSALLPPPLRGSFVVTQVVPKRHIANVKALKPVTDDVSLVQRLFSAGTAYLDSLRTPAAPAPALDDRRFVFHVPPGNSIDHLHLHAFEGRFVSWTKRNIVYNPRVNPCCEYVARTIAERLRIPGSVPTTSKI